MLHFHSLTIIFSMLWVVNGCNSDREIFVPERSENKKNERSDKFDDYSDIPTRRFQNNQDAVKAEDLKDSPPSSPSDEPKVEFKPALFADLPKQNNQLKKLCDRPGSDKIRQVFCNSNPPKISSLKDLQRALGLEVTDSGGNENNRTVGFTFTAASSSLVAKETSSINPRLILFTRAFENLVSLGFVRGEQFVELAARDSASGVIKFFLVVFEQACNTKPSGCNFGDLLTPAIETGWTNITIYEDLDLENTIVDCLQCHQPAGTGTPKILRMQERVNPWLHFMRTNRPGGLALLEDFKAAHGNEEYAGIPSTLFDLTDPAQLQALVEDAGFINQPNEFNSPIIIQETTTLGSNVRPPEWLKLYDGFVQGRFIAPPYHQLRISSPGKLAAMTEHYQDYRSGKINKDNLKDIRDVFDDGALRDIGFMVKDGLSGDEILVQACSQCHHQALNQTISRAKFKMSYKSMSCEDRDKAIERLRLSKDNIQRMPPAKFRSLTEDEIKKVEAVLRCQNSQEGSSK